MTADHATESWSGRTVLVTGATGFAGRWLVHALLARGATVVRCARRVTTKTPDTLFPGDLAIAPPVVGTVEDAAFMDEIVRRHLPDVVFHLAAQAVVGQARDDPVATFETNIRGTWLLLDACRREAPAARVVVASSDQAYGVQRAQPCAEDHPLAGRHPYDVSKSCADLIAISYADTYGVAVGVARFSNLFGPGDMNISRLVPGAICAALQNRRPLIRSDGSPTRDYLYVGDMVMGCLRLAECLAEPAIQGRAYNFASGEPLSVLAMTRLALAAAGRSDLEPDVRNEPSGEIQHKQLSIEAAARDLGWRPAASTAQHLTLTAAWYREHLNASAPSASAQR